MPEKRKMSDEEFKQDGPEAQKIGNYFSEAFLGCIILANMDARNQNLITDSPFLSSTCFHSP